MEKVNFGIVIVTYNRLELLKECLQHVFMQTYAADQVVVVNNNSTDGTYEYLEQAQKGNNNLQVFHLKENIGGAGGFHFGLSKVHKSLDYILIIDDDAMICDDFLYNILIRIEPRIEAYSGTVYTEGIIDTSHRRIIKNMVFMLKKDVDREQYERESFLYDLSTFCGLIISRKLLDVIGLPEKNFFIWYDDSEYSLRIREYTEIKNINSARINHKTKVEFKTKLSWKSYYGYRNQIYLGKKYSRCPQLFLLYRYCYHIYRIISCLFRAIFSRKDYQYYLNCVYLNISVIKDTICNKVGISSKFYPGKQI